jgi:hypothetical protein
LIGLIVILFRISGGPSQNKTQKIAFSGNFRLKLWRVWG